MATAAPAPIRLLVENRRARAKYAIDETLEVGIALVGIEVKSIRDAKIELADAYAAVESGQLWLHNAYIAPFKHATTFGHEPKRARRLLAHRTEIDKLDAKVVRKGYTIIPLRVYVKGSIVKIEIGLARGKDHEDRREDIKRREGQREARRAMERRRT